MELDDKLDTLVFYTNHDYLPPSIYCKGWLVTYAPSGIITDVIAIMDTGEWRPVWDLKNDWEESFKDYAIGNPPE